MLRFLSQKQRARNLLLILVALMMVVGLVILYMPIGQALYRRAIGSGEVTDSTVVAEVQDQKITAGEYRAALMRLTQSRLGRGFDDPALLRPFRSTILNELIEDRLVLLLARELGLSATDEEVFKALLPMFRDASGRFIGRERYFRAVQQSGQTVEEFEENLRRSILRDKVRHHVTAALQVSPREIEEEFFRENASVDLVYVVIRSKDLRAEIPVSEGEARAYFEKHRGEFAITQLERQVEYLHIPMARIPVSVSEEEIRQEYERTKSEHTTGADVSQIELPFTEQNEADVRRHAEELVKRARGDEKTPAEDFRKLGGRRLGFVKKDPTDTSYRQRVFSLSDAQKDVTEPIREEGRFYILKVTRWQRKPLAEVRADLVRRIRERKQRDEAAKLADEIKKRLDEVKDLRRVAAEFSPKLGNLPVEQMVRRTGFFAAGEDLPEFGEYASGFTSAASELTEIGQIGSKIYLSDGYAIPRLIATREPKTPTFEEVKDRVIRKLQEQKAIERARQRAEDVIARSPTVDALRRTAAAYKLEVKTHEGFKRGSFLPGLEHSEALEGMAFALSASRVAPRPVRIGTDFVVLGITKRSDPDRAKFDAEREALRERVLSTKRDQFYRAYLETLREKMIADGRIRIHQDVIEAIFSQMTGSAPARAKR
jgi:peptidyl-prolyl cis-trans isomerase D